MNTESASSAEIKSAQVLGPVGTSERIDSIDVLRGVAVLGILSINIFGFALPSMASLNPSVMGPLSQADWIAYFVAWFALEGSQRAIFSMLFGAGVILFTSRIMASERAIFGKRLYYRRTLWLIAFGLIDAYILFWPGDILFHYGLAGLLLYFMRDWTPRKLLTLAGIIFAVLALVRILLMFSMALMEGFADSPDAAERLNMTEEQFEDFQMTMGHVDPEYVQQEIEERSSGFVSAFIPNAEISFKNQTVNTIVMLFWDVLMLMLIGMALYRWRVLDASRSLRFYVCMAIGGLAVGYSVNLWEISYSFANDFWVAYFFWTYDIGRIATGLGYIGVVMLICKLQIWSIVRNSLAAVGRMALTNYVMHTLICNTIFIGFGLFGSLGIAQMYIVVASIWIAQLLYSPWWLSKFKYGPLEWLWRKLTYGKLAQKTISMR
ncbi:MAG: DUF418 domain-containing protein [Gammaproteobacteria bacterium]|nr:DUF418 domain-containing protein [Gammaproteobacteria bacterium]